MNYDIIVIGSGPGGYVTAIRASQLGFKTAIIEKENLGGICLNWGCIPTKALLKSAQVFKYIEHAEEYGLNKVEPSFEFPNIIQRSRGVANKMSKGIEFLMKKNKIDVILGTAKVLPGKKVEVTDAEGKNKLMQVRISLSQLVHVPVNCQTFRRMAKSNRLPSGTKLTRAAKIYDCCRFRSYRC